MRRITFTIVVTVAILVLLFSYRTSTQGPTITAASSAGAHIVSGTTAGTTTTTSGPPNPTTDTSARQQITVPSTSAAPNTTPPKRKAAPSTGASTTPAPIRVKAAPTTTAAPTTSAASKDVVVDGAAEMTRYGAVQVEVTISGGKITNAQAIAYPNQEPRDQEINSNAIPQLQGEVISAQSAQIDGVSGATYTSEGFISSLQSALDAANFK